MGLALKASANDIVFMGGPEAGYYVCAARQMDPIVTPAFFSFISQKVDGSTDTTLDVFGQYLDNPVTDLLFHFKIKDSIDGVKQVGQVVTEAWNAVEAKVAAIAAEQQPIRAVLD